MSYATQANAIVAAMIGTGLIFDVLQDAAMASRADLDALTEETRVKLCDTFSLPAKTSLSALQAAKVPKAGTFYTYVLALRSFFKADEPCTRVFLVKTKGEITRETFDVASIKAGIVTAQSKLAKELAESKADTGADTGPSTGADTVSGAPAGAAPTGPVLTLPAILAALEAMHASNMIDDASYARLAALRPIVKATPMADVVELKIAA